MAAVSLFMASKTEECPRKAKDVIAAFSALRKDQTSSLELKTITLPDFLVMERRILVAIDYDMQHVLPYSASSVMICELKNRIPKDYLLEMRQTIYNFISDRFSWTLLLLFP